MIRPAPLLRRLVALLLVVALAITLFNACGRGRSGGEEATPVPPPPPGPITGLYTDLIAAPVGAYVTAYGVDAATASWPVVLHGNQRTVVRVPANPPPLTINGHTFVVTINNGRVIEVTPDTLAAAVTALRPGDILYLHAGTYTGHYGATYWNESSFVLTTPGTPDLPIAIVAYPGEIATIDNTAAAGAGRPNFHLGTDEPGKLASHLTLAGLNLVAQGITIYGAGNTSNSDTPESGAAHVRVIACTHTVTDRSSNTATGIIALQGDDWKVLGNTFHDPVDRQVIKNNHGIYVQNGADNVEIAFNILSGLHTGHAIQVHQDGTPMVYDNLWIHHNLIEGDAIDDMRGITVSNVAAASIITITDNTLRNVGQGFGGVTVYHGIVSVRGNTFANINGDGIQANGADASRVIYASGNRFADISGEHFAAINGARAETFVHE